MEIEHKTGQIADNQRIALLIAGQMRTYMEAYGYLKQNILEPLDPDVFIHTESTTGITNRLGLQAGKMGNNEKVTKESLVRLYDPVKVHISEPFSAEQRREYEGVRVPDVLIEAEPDHWQGNIPNFYGIYECNELKQEHERDHGFKYDLVIRMRPDLRIPQELPVRVLKEKDVLWHTHSNAPAQVSDKLAVSNSENMDYYASVWKQLDEYWENPLGDGDWEDYRVGERLLAHHMDQSGISVKKFNMNSRILRSRKYIRKKNAARTST